MSFVADGVKPRVLPVKWFYKRSYVETRFIKL